MAIRQYGNIVGRQGVKEALPFNHLFVYSHDAVLFSHVIGCLAWAAHMFCHGHAVVMVHNNRLCRTKLEAKKRVSFWWLGRSETETPSVALVSESDDYVSR